MLEFKNCKLIIDLEAQSPLIHFQTDSVYSRTTTLRASEVKPKLDRFLLKKLQLLNNYKDLQEIKNNHKLFFIDSEHNALNYAMKIENKNVNPKIIDLNPEDRGLRYDLYYGNAGKHGEDIKKGVISNPTVTIFCFIPELRKIIQDNIIEFFIISNFGTMQNKGFGSFLPLNCGYNSGLTEEQINYIADCLLHDVINSMEEKRNKIKTCYYMKFPQITNRSMDGKNKYFLNFFKEIKTFYSIMKSGQNHHHGYARSYIYEYMHERNIDNEKAWLKQQHISPIVGRRPMESSTIQNNNPKYVRAMLGTGMTLSYIRDQENPSDKVSISISSNSDIKRVSSPIFFKIIKNIVFIIAKEIPKEIYNQSFTFTNDFCNESECLKTPEEFDIDDFLDNYVKYYNGELKNKVSNIKKNVEVVKICQSLSE